jgi:hypothetical protein
MGLAGGDKGNQRLIRHKRQLAIDKKGLFWKGKLVSSSEKAWDFIPI